MFRSTDLVSRRSQEHCHALANAWLIVNNKDSVLGCVAHGRHTSFVLDGT
jgi:hypothetical protein